MSHAPMESWMNLPDEIWLLILGMVPLEDRVKSVQHSNKRLRALCFDSAITRSIDLSSAVLVPEEDCLKVVIEVKSSVRHLSLNGCHWLTAKFFSKIPQLQELKSLSMVECCLTRTQLTRLLTKLPQLKKIAFSITLSEMAKFSPAEALKANANTLDRLHIDCIIDEGEERDNAATFVNGLKVLVNSLKPSQSLSFTVSSRLKGEVAEPVFFHSVSELTVDVQWAFSVYNQNWRSLFKHFYLLSLCEARGLDGEERRIDLSKLRYLAMPPFSHYSSFRPADFGNGRFYHPNDMANLECLIAQFPEKDTSYAYFLRDLILNCSYPKLKCLNIGNETYTSGVGDQTNFPVEFYCRLQTLNHLEELNLKNLHIDLNCLAVCLEHLEKLRCLSIPLNGSITKKSSWVISHHAPHKRQRVSRYPKLEKCEFFQDLVKHLPCLEKLEITQVPSYESTTSARILEPVGDLNRLKELKLENVRFMDPMVFSNVLRKLISLQSLTLGDVGHQSHCEYPNILFGSLRLLPGLIGVRLQHPRLELAPQLLREICNCKRLEVLILRSTRPCSITATTVLKDFKAIMSNCARLHRFAFINPSLPDSATKSIVGFSKNLKKSGRDAALFAGPSTSGRCRAIPARLTDISRSIVGVCNPYEFLESCSAF